MNFHGLQINVLRRLEEYFQEKNWNASDEYSQLFDNFCKLLSSLNAEETELILNLTRDYLWVRHNDYYKYLIDSLNIFAACNHKLKTIYIMPMISPNDRVKRKIKSSVRIAYNCAGFGLDLQVPYLKNIDIHLIHNIEDSLPNPNKMSESITLMVDDYIGAGQTAVEALDELQKIKNYNKDKIQVLALVAQQQGVDAINANGYNNVHCAVVRNRGITDNYSTLHKEFYAGLMNGIEEQMNISDDFRFGKSGSEALVTMIRTPNNTFPIFWHKPKYWERWEAPFIRKK